MTGFGEEAALFVRGNMGNSPVAPSVCGRLISEYRGFISDRVIWESCLIHSMIGSDCKFSPVAPSGWSRLIPNVGRIGAALFGQSYWETSSTACSISASL